MGASTVPRGMVAVQFDQGELAQLASTPRLTWRALALLRLRALAPGASRSILVEGTLLQCSCRHRHHKTGFALPGEDSSTGSTDTLRLLLLAFEHTISTEEHGADLP